MANLISQPQTEERKMPAGPPFVLTKEKGTGGPLGYTLIEGRRSGYRVRAIALDFLILLMLFPLLSVLRFGGDWTRHWEVAIGGAYLGGFIAVSMAGVAVFAFLGHYHASLKKTSFSYGIEAARGILPLAAFTLASLYFFRFEEVSRTFLIAYFALAPLALTVERVALRQHMVSRLNRKQAGSHLLLIGARELIQDFRRSLEVHPEAGFKIVGHLQVPGQPCCFTDSQEGHLGSIDSLSEILASRVVDEVAICLPMGEWGRTQEISSTCAQQGKPALIPINLRNIGMHGSKVESWRGGLVLTSPATSFRGSQQAVKRAFDISLSIICLAVASVPMAAVAWTLWVVQGRPIIYSQQRAGLHGRTFTLYKFRTMVKEADELRPLLADLNERSGPDFKIQADPRITPVGGFLRRTSLDEFPQFYNILKGDMSFVGPRAQYVEEVAGYDYWHRRRLAMRPGLTGLWQVTARQDPDFDSRVRIDLDYIDNWSFWLDLYILVRTLPAVLKRTGN